MTDSLKRIVVLLFFLAALVFSTIAGAAEVCRLPLLEGFEAPAKRAQLLLPIAKTTDSTKAVLYIEKHANGFYYHSNFITPGYDNPTKIGSEKLTDASWAFINVVYDEQPSPAARAKTEEIFRNNVEVLLDTSVFDADGYPLIDLKGAKKVKIVDGKAGKALTGPGIELLDRSTPPPLLLSKVLGCCFFGIPPHLAPRFGELLRKRSFQASEVRFFSLIRDSGTESAINETITLKSLRVGEPAKNISSLPQVEKAFQAARGKTVILVSHVEGENFVIRNPKKQITFSSPINEVRSLAKKYQIELIDLGCRTAQEIRTESMGLGVTTKFNTVNAVKSIEQALSNSRHYADFFEKITSEGLKVVVDGKFVQSTSLRADIYSKLAERPIWVKIAQLFVSFRSS